MAVFRGHRAPFRRPRSRRRQIATRQPARAYVFCCLAAHPSASPGNWRSSAIFLSTVIGDDPNSRPDGHRGRASASVIERQCPLCGYHERVRATFVVLSIAPTLLHAPKVRDDRCVEMKEVVSIRLNARVWGHVSMRSHSYSAYLAARRASRVCRVCAEYVACQVACTRGTTRSHICGRTTPDTPSRSGPLRGRRLGRRPGSALGIHRSERGERIFPIFPRHVPVRPNELGPHLTPTSGTLRSRKRSRPSSWSTGRSPGRLSESSA
jgi:hypothetical protein